MCSIWLFKVAYDLLHKSSVFSGHTSEVDRTIKENAKNSSSLWIHMKIGLVAATPCDGMRTVNIKTC